MASPASRKMSGAGLLRRSRSSLQAAIDDSLAYSALLFSMKAQERALIDELQEKYTEAVPDAA